MKIRAFIFFAFGTVLLLTGCNMSPDYNIDFPPPSNNAKPIDIFPASINIFDAKVENPLFGGTKVFYGPNMMIYAARLGSKKEAIAFFKEHLLKEYKECSSNFSGTINGQFYAKASGKEKRMFGWANENYVFSIGASNKEELNQVIDNFKFISKK